MRLPPALPLLAAALVLSCGSPASRAQGVVFTPYIESSLDAPVDLQAAPGNANGLYVVEQRGRIVVVSEGAVQLEPFLDITDRVRYGGEQGLLGLAFHPAWPDSAYVYVNYTRDHPDEGDPQPYQTVIARFEAEGGLANPFSEQILLTIDDPYDNHNAGALAFGPDGYLYVGTGDGGSGGDPLETGQNRADLLGSFLRLDVNGGGNPPDCGGPEARYTIPADNPLSDGSGGDCDELFAYGFRNPWRMSFDAATGDLWTGDVGQNRFEEVDVVRAGENYGWDVVEGVTCFEPSSGCNQAGLTPPVYTYGRSEGFSITGGYVYRGSRIPELVGKYVFGDFGGAVWALTYDGTNPATVERLGTVSSLSSFGEDAVGELYALSLNGTIYRLDPTGSAAEDDPREEAVTLALDGSNPVRGRATLRMGAAAGGDARLALFDGAGRKVATLFEGALAPGSVRAVALDAAALAPGVYVARLDVADPARGAPGGTRSLRLTVVR